MVEHFIVTVGGDMPGRTHELDVDRIIEEIIDTEITAVAVVDLLG